MKKKQKKGKLPSPDLNKHDVGKSRPSRSDSRQLNSYSNHLHLLPIALVAVAIGVIGVLLLVDESDVLWKSQELNLFLYSTSFFKEQMVVPGGALVWLGCYFTQFFYYPWLGVLLLCLWWGLLAYVTAKAFHIQAKWLFLVLSPIIALLGANVILGYWLYYLKLRGYMFVATIGCTLGASLVWLYRLLHARFFLRPLLMVVVTVVGYPLFGFYALLAVALMAVITWRLPGSITVRVLTTAVALVCVIAVPMIAYRHFFYQTNSENIFAAALPIFFVESDEHTMMEAARKIFYWPYYICGAFFVLAAAFYRPRPFLAKVRKPFAWALALCCTLSALASAAHLFWYKDYNFHEECRMMRCVEHQDWEGVLTGADQHTTEPTRCIVMLRNLALARLGREGDEMYRYWWGAKSPTATIPVRMTQVGAKMIYYNYGQVNYCYRWCLEDGVEYGWRAEFLKYLTRCALVNGEHQVARKYIHILKQTRYHRSWAEEQERFVGHMAALKSDVAYEPIFHMMNYEDRLTSDRSVVEQFLNYELARLESDDPVLQEQSLVSALWTKDIPTFWPQFFKYVELHPGKRIPTHYQEAAVLYSELEHQVDLSNFPIDENIRTSFNNFMARAQQYGGYSMDMLKERMYPEFGGTFFYEYFLNRDQQMY